MFFKLIGPFLSLSAELAKDFADRQITPTEGRGIGSKFANLLVTAFPRINQASKEALAAGLEGAAEILRG